MQTPPAFDPFLDGKALRALTGRARPKAQIEALKAMKIRHKVNALGRPIVAWAWLGVGQEAELRQFVEPNFEGLRV